MCDAESLGAPDVLIDDLYSIQFALGQTETLLWFPVSLDHAFSASHNAMDGSLWLNVTCPAGKLADLTYDDSMR